MTATSARWSGRALGRAAVRRLPVFAIMWWAFAEGAAYGWPLAVAAVLTSFAASVIVSPPDRSGIRLAALPRFVPFFLWQSLRGGLDVARRALHPSLPIAPGFYEHRFNLPVGPARIMMTAIVTLVPGTLSASISGDVLLVHVLDRRMDVATLLNRLERRVAQLF